MREATSARAALMLKTLGVVTADVRALTDGWTTWLKNGNKYVTGDKPGK